MHPCGIVIVPDIVEHLVHLHGDLDQVDGRMCACKQPSSSGICGGAGGGVGHIPGLEPGDNAVFSRVFPRSRPLLRAEALDVHSWIGVPEL